MHHFQAQFLLIPFALLAGSLLRSWLVCELDRPVLAQEFQQIHLLQTVLETAIGPGLPQFGRHDDYRLIEQFEQASPGQYFRIDILGQSDPLQLAWQIATKISQTHSFLEADSSPDQDTVKAFFKTCVLHPNTSNQILILTYTVYPFHIEQSSGSHLKIML